MFEVVVWILLTYYSFRLSVSSNFIVISACSSLSTSFLSLNLVLGLSKDVMLSFLLLIFVIEMLGSSLKFLSPLYFYNHGY